MTHTDALNVGPFVITCSVGDSPFEISTKVRELRDGDLSEVVIDFSSHSPARLPELTLTWSVPMQECHLKWTTASEGASAIVPWKGAASLASRTTRNAPVYSIFSIDGTNRLTFAVSDVLNASVLRAMMVEETAEIACSVELRNDSKATRTNHQVTLRIDTRSIPYSQAIADVAGWWAGLPGYEPLTVPREARLPMYSTWYSYHQGISASAIEAECRVARSMGMESIIVDDGWQTDDNNRGYAHCGDWEVTPTKFSDFAGHVSRVQEMGLKYLLWFSVPFVGIHSQAYQRFKDRVLPAGPDAQYWPLDPRYPEVRSFIAEKYRDFVSTYGLDGLKLDFVDQFAEPTEERNDPPPGRDNVSVAEAAATLLSEVADTLKELNPNIMLEFRQPYIGPYMRRCGNIFRVGDVPNDFPSNRINSIDLRLLSGNTAVHSDMIMWHPDDPVASAALQLLHTLFAVPQISVRIAELSDEHRAMLAHYLSFWRKYQDVLLDGEFRPLEPGSGYPQVQVRNSDTFLAAVYARTPVTLPEDVPGEVVLVNGTMDDRIWLDAGVHAGETWIAKAFDCMGKVSSGEQGLTLDSTQTLPVPPSGVVILRCD